MTEKEKKPGPYFVFIILFILFGANINVLDVLPDCIAFGLLAHRFSHASYVCPHFREARSALIKLCIVDLCKIPVGLLMLAIRNANLSERDVFVLGALIFSVTEAVLCIYAVNNLFSALSYLGVRTDNAALLRPFRFFGKNCTPDFVRGATVAFFLIKYIGSCVPDFYLLTKISGTIATSSIDKYLSLLIVFLLLITVIGILWMVMCMRYYRAILSCGTVCDTVAEMEANCDRSALGEESLDHTLRALSVLGFGAVTWLPVMSEHRILLLPATVFALLFYVGLSTLSSQKKMPRYIKALAGVWGLIGLGSYVCSVWFVDRYGFSALLQSAEARDAYRLPLYASIAENFALCVFLILLCVALCRFIRSETGADPTLPSYGKTERSFHRALEVRAIVFALYGTVCGVCRALSYYFDGRVKTIETDEYLTGSSAVLSGSVEWFHTLLFLLTVGFVLYSLWFFSTLRDEVRLKHEWD